MFNLIYILLGIYAIKIILIKVNMEYSKRRTLQAKQKHSFFKVIYSNFKNVFAEKNNLFVFNNKIEEEKYNNKLADKEECHVKRQMALEKSKYKCEECGNIANLDVYNKGFNSSNDELVVLCKRCYEKDIAEANLHYGQN